MNFSSNPVRTNATQATCTRSFQDQVQDRLLVKRRNDNHSPGPVTREISPKLSPEK